MNAFWGVERQTIFGGGGAEVEVEAERRRLCRGGMAAGRFRSRDLAPRSLLGMRGQCQSGGRHDFLPFECVMATRFTSFSIDRGSKMGEDDDTNDGVCEEEAVWERTG